MYNTTTPVGGEIHPVAWKAFKIFYGIIAPLFVVSCTVLAKNEENLNKVNVEEYCKPIREEILKNFNQYPMATIKRAEQENWSVYVSVKETKDHKPVSLMASFTVPVPEDRIEPILGDSPFSSHTCRFSSYASLK